MSEREAWRAEAAAAGERLDHYLARHFRVARNRTASWIRDGLVTVEGRPAKASLRLAGGERLTCTPRPLEQIDMTPEEGPLVVLHEDPEIVVVDKPAGMVVHPGAGRESGTLAHRLLARYPEIAAVGGPGRPGIVHRLDRGTTGVMVVARTAAAYQALSRAFSERRTTKTYLAVVYGRPRPEEGAIELAIARHPKRRKEMAVVAGGRPALTRYRTLATAAGISLVRVDLLTGRTHQIRVHFKAIRRPLVGDPVYSGDVWKGLPGPVRSPLSGFARPALHAWRLELEHPQSGVPMRFEALPPEDLLELWESVTGLPLPQLDPPRRSGPPPVSG